MTAEAAMALVDRRWVLTPYRRLYGMGSTDDAMAVDPGEETSNFDRNVTDQYTDRVS